MNQKSFLLLALCANLPLLAQAPGALTVSVGDASLTAYGILDAGIANVQHSLDFDEYHPVTINPTVTKAPKLSALGMFNGGISQTRIGFKGAADLGDGWKAVFTLESAINIPNGNVSDAAESLALNRSTGPAMGADSAISGQLFGRNANFGVSSDTYGTFTIGRHTSFMLDVIPAYDALQGAQLFTPIGFSGMYGGGGATDSSRLDSSAKYRVKVGEFTLGALYKFGGVAGASTANGATEVLASWEHGPFGVVAAYQKVTDATKVGNPSNTVIQTTVSTPVTAANPNGTAVITQVSEPIGTIVLTCEDTKSTMLAARYQVGRWLFTAGYEYMQLTNPSDPTQDLAITSLYGFPVGNQITVSATTGMPTGSAPAINVTPFTINGSAAEEDLTVLWLGAKFAFTDKLSLAVSYYHVGQNNFSNGGTGAAFAADQSGSTKYASALLDYTWSKAFDAYLGYMNVQGSGGMVAGYNYDNNATLGAGFRYKF